MTSCDHGMPDPATCVDCMTEGNLAPPPLTEPERADSRPFTAKYDGHCQACNLPTMTGQQIVHTNRGRYIHLSCVEETP